MIQLKVLDLAEIEKKKQKVIDIEEELQREKGELRDMLIALNLDYYGTSPSKYYKGITKKYVTSDGYSVRIEQGNISISKKIQDNLTVTWCDTFNEHTTFSLYKSIFEYDSGRCIDSSIIKNRIKEKHSAEIIRIQEILEEEQIYNPFVEYARFYSFVDFHNIKNQ